MTTDELIEVLKKYPARRVILSADGGYGIDFSPLHHYSASFYDEETSWYGSNRESAVDEPVIILWPIN